MGGFPPNPTLFGGLNPSLLAFFLGSFGCFWLFFGFFLGFWGFFPQISLKSLGFGVVWADLQPNPTRFPLIWVCFMGFVWAVSALSYPVLAHSYLIWARSYLDFVHFSSFFWVLGDFSP